jgi:hypothetical protein
LAHNGRKLPQFYEFSTDFDRDTKNPSSAEQERGLLIETAVTDQPPSANSGNRVMPPSTNRVWPLT